MADTLGVECHAPAGSLVFWHACLLHGAGINRVPGTIRQSVIYDFHLTEQATEEASAAAVAEWPTVEEEERTLWYYFSTLFVHFPLVFCDVWRLKKEGNNGQGWLGRACCGGSDGAR